MGCPEGNLITTKKVREHQNYSLFLEFNGVLNSFLPRIFHRVREGVNLVMIPAFTLILDVDDNWGSYLAFHTFL